MCYLGSVSVEMCLIFLVVIGFVKLGPRRLNTVGLYTIAPSVPADCSPLFELPNREKPLQHHLEPECCLRKIFPKINGQENFRAKVLIRLLHHTLSAEKNVIS